MSELLEGPRGWWSVDWLITGYLAATGVLIAAFAGRVPHSATLLALHAAGILLVVWAIHARSGRLQAVFRHWYPLPYVSACYREMAVLIPAIRGVDYDASMERFDQALWRVSPTLWLERIQRPALTEFLQIIYALFVPAVLLVAVVLWRRRCYARFRYYAFLIALGFLASYIGYFLVPVRGPRFSLAQLGLPPLRGLWLSVPLQRVLDVLESAHYDCFPSGHTELTLLAWWSSRALSPAWFLAYSGYAAAIILATIYLRYHYTVDVFAGVLLASILLVAAPRLYGGSGR